MAEVRLNIPDDQSPAPPSGMPPHMVEARRPASPITNSIAFTLDPSTLPGVVAPHPVTEIPEGTLSGWAFNAPDAELRDALVSLEFGPVDPIRSVRGIWRVRLTQAARAGMVDLTAPVPIFNPGTSPFRLGRPIRSMEFGRAVYMHVVYSAPSGPSALFWTGLLAIRVTVNMN